MLWSSAAAAQSPSEEPINTAAGMGLFVTLNEEADENGYLGQIVHRNGLTHPSEAEDFYEFDTARGVVILQLETTRNTDCPGPNNLGCPDTLTIWELPPGVTASAMESVTPEMETIVIDLFEWTGM